MRNRSKAVPVTARQAFSPEDIENLYGILRGTQSKLRMQPGVFIPYVKVAGQVRYLARDVEQYFNGRRRLGTRTPAAPANPMKVA